MLRKFDYLLEKEEEEPYNFIQEPEENSTDENDQPFYNNQIYRKKGRTMHIMLEPR